MTHSFDYMYTTTAMDSITIDNIGDCTLNVFNDSYQEYYLDIATKLGITKIISYGPLLADSNDLEDSFCCSYKSMPYDERKLIKIIDNFISDPKKNITQAMLVEHSLAVDRLKQLNIADLLQ